MAKSKVTFSIKTPTRYINSEDKTKILTAWKNEVEANVVRTTVTKISKYTGWAINQELRVLATFFQRVVSRTPLDENYEGHLKDDNQCRYDWYIKFNGKTLTAKELHSRHGSMFNNYNSKEDIDLIYDSLRFMFKKDMSNVNNFVIGNENDHFYVLEYGGKKIKPYKKGEGDISQGPLYEHGVENFHSVQAPVGMLRITQMEMEAIRKDVKSSAAAQLRKTDNKINPSDEKIKEIVNRMKKRKGIRWDDIAEYIEGEK